MPMLRLAEAVGLNCSLGYNINYGLNTIVFWFPLSSERFKVAPQLLQTYLFDDEYLFYRIDLLCLLSKQFWQSQYSCFSFSFESFGT